MVSLKNPKNKYIGDIMATILDEIIEELNESVLSGKFGVDEIYGDLIRRLFHLSDDVKDYIFYELDSEAHEKYNLHKETPTEQYFYNLCDRIWSLGESYEKAEEVEVFDNFNVSDNVLTFGVLTMTACAEPDVNYYDDGSDSVKAFIEELKDIIQIDDITYVEDWDFDEMGGGPTQSGDIIIKLGGK